MYCYFSRKSSSGYYIGDYKGSFLTLGDDSVRKHTHGTENPCRGICTAYDIDGDGKTEVIVEAWDGKRPMLYVLEGATGEVEAEATSPFDNSVTDPKGYTEYLCYFDWTQRVVTLTICRQLPGSRYLEIAGESFRYSMIGTAFRSSRRKRREQRHW